MFSLHVNYGKRVREGKERGKKRRETLQAHLQVLKVGRWAFKAAGFGSTIFRSFSRKVGIICCANGTIDCI
jgi:hypothetical protein